MPRSLTAPEQIASQRRRVFLRALTLLALPARVQSATIAQPDLRVLAHNTGEATQQIVAVLKREFPGAQVGSDIEGLAQRPGGIFVAIGPAALRTALAANLNRPLVSLFVSNDTYMRLLDQFPAGRSFAMTTAIFAEAAPVDQLRLVRHLYGQPVLVGALLSSNTAHLEPELTLAARAAGLEVKIQMVSRDETAARAISRLADAKVLLAIPDQALYTSDSIRAVLETGYRRNLAMVGFSQALVSAGALASAYASIDDIVLHLRQWVQPLAAGHIPKPQYPMYWRVAINDRVAASLDVPIDPSVRTLGNRPEGAQ